MAVTTRGIHLRVQELRLKNYRAFASARIEFNPITFLVGRNGTGKSTLMDALAFMSESIGDSLATALERRGNLAGVRRRPGAGRPHDISIALQFGANASSDTSNRAVYGFRIGSNPKSASSYQVKGEYLQDRFGKEGFVREGDEFRNESIAIKPGLDPGALVLPTIAQASPLWNAVYQSLRGISVHQFSARTLQ